jgi:hypothetical protein
MSLINLYFIFRVSDSCVLRSRFRSDKEETSLGLTEASGVLLMLNKDERLVINELLLFAFQSESIKNYLREKLGIRSKPGVGRKKQLPKGFSDYVQVAENLLKNMSNSISFRYLAE